VAGRGVPAYFIFFVKIDHQSVSRPYRISDGGKFRLKDVDPGAKGDAKMMEQADDLLAGGLKLLSDLQGRLYAQHRWSLLLIFQGMDAAGKDGTIKHVMSGVNPQGCQVTSFKAPSATELDHDFLWRCTLALPERGRIGIFNRSYYEEVLVIRVHRHLLEAESLAGAARGKHFWRERFEDINAFERHLARNGTVIRKFFLHLSKAEQKKRFLARLDEPSKNWKLSAADLKERDYWDDYQKAYEKMVRATATGHAPWYVVPADDKKYARLVVAGAIVETLESLKVDFPKVTAAQRDILDQARKILE
jgi:PPK2 family polyphosphate:nucleotide phosphotransferase